MQVKFRALRLDLQLQQNLILMLFKSNPIGRRFGFWGYPAPNHCQFYWIPSLFNHNPHFGLGALMGNNPDLTASGIFRVFKKFQSIFFSHYVI